MSKSKWFDTVIESYVSKNEFENYKMIINNLSEKQVNTFQNCMKFSHNKLFIYENENYEVKLYVDTQIYKCSLTIKNLKQIKIDNLKAEIEQLKNDIAEETNEEFMREDTELVNKLEADLKELEG
jgi:uncharacterized ferredoxin-like protein